MTRKLKALGLALLAVFAMSAVGAQAAMATEGTFQWDEGTTDLTAEADPTAPSQVFTITTKSGATGTVTCNEVSGTASVSSTASTTVTAQKIVWADEGTTPATNQCTGKIGTSEVQMEVNMHGCDFRFHAGTTVGPLENHTTEGTVDVVCENPGEEIEVKGTGCIAKIPETNNQNLGPVFFHTTNTAGKEEVTAEATVGTMPESEHNKAITYTTEGAICGKQVEAGDRSNGTYVGKITIKGYNSTTEHNSAHQTNVTVT